MILFLMATMAEALSKDISFVVDRNVAFMMIKLNLMLSQVVHSISKVLLVHHSTCHSLLKFLFILHILQCWCTVFVKYYFIFPPTSYLSKELVIGLPLSGTVSQRPHTKLVLQHI